ncbi:hypothetical protein HWV23_02795 [Natronomonas halophila]|uniref:hypothetical protein n=1 Tax=Natronomonas halophila TaxID=2747817 RepID=UPI0015B58463|nr:hypothetical protein [Natronomonas halophila]QLD84630.1 hypothetical protein HWV23_02520 [Natronomonas halophila]QLD84684.1 hypothetical protein HWV23_02795 [Natronomonas halophila]
MTLRERVSPEWVDWTGWVSFDIETSRGCGRLDTIAEAIPDAVFDHWTAGADTVVGLLVISWVTVLFVLFGYGFANTVDTLLTSDWATFFGQPPEREPAPLPSLSQAAIGLAQLYLGVIGAIGLLVPGMILHEGSHAIVLEKYGNGIDTYGLSFTAGIPKGAFVKPTEGILSNQEFRAVFAVGPMANVTWAVALASIASLVSGSVGFGLKVLAGAEVLIVLTNTAPFPGSDGQLFLKMWYDEWLGIEAAMEAAFEGFHPGGAST